MEKRLIDAYDHMTMPEDCTRRIEARLQTELQGRKPGRYTKTVSPFAPRRSGWAAAAACLLLVLVMGGVAGKLWMTSAVVDVPSEAVEGYALVTELSVMEVESFAAGLRQNVLEKNWEAFSRKVQYPITIGDKTVADRQELVELIVENRGSDAFVIAIRKETCSDMFCNWQGICMGDGQLWFNEIDGELKVTAINGLLANTLDPENFVLKLLPDGNYTVVEYAGQETVIAIPASKSERLVTTIGTGQAVITGSDRIETIWIPTTVKEVRENAFANCPALEAVFFEGDAPPEAEGVFEGSKNVYVYYQNGKEGWGDTWCGRETREYSHHVSLGTATVQDRVPVSFYDDEGKMAIEGYYTDMWGGIVQPKAFTVVDMDRDGICELVLAPQDEYETSRSYLMLSDNGTGICAYTLWGRDIRKDGTFYSFAARENARLQPRGALGYTIESVDFRLQDKPLAQWHVYPSQMFDLVLESYLYASESGISTSPGYGYYYFKSLAYGEMENNWNSIQYWMSREGVCIEDKDMVYAFDPDAPGCVFYGALTGEGDQRKFTSIGYYICEEAAEYRAEVFDLDQPNPVYTVDVPPDDRGREVETPEEMMAYLGHTPYYDEINRDAQKVAELLDSFVYRYATHDTKGMKEYMAETSGDLSSYPFTGKVAIVNYGMLPSETVVVGDTWHTSVELLESGESNAHYHLAVALIKESDGWKVRSYGLEEQ